MSSSTPDASPLSHIPAEILSARPYLLSIDRTARGLGRYELTSFFADPSSLPKFVSDVCAHFTAKLPVDAIVGLDALGFPLAGAMALRLGVGCLLARKRGKLALPTEEIAVTDGIRDYSVERAGEKGLEIRKDLLRRGMRVIVV
jgi:adenine phosphoribosyltransferase